MSRVVVTGAQGLLGRHVTAALLDTGVEAVLGLGRSERRDDVFTHTVTARGPQVAAVVPRDLRARLEDPRRTYEPIDLAVTGAVEGALARFRPDVVIHAAAALRDSSWEDLLWSNVRGTIGLVEGAAAAGVRRLVLVSSGSVYGAAGGHVPIREDSPAEPMDPYGVTKRTAEDVSRVLARRHGLSVVNARVFNLIGPGLQERHLPALLAAHVAWAVREPGHRLSLGPLDSTRDFVDVRDTARALVLLAGLEALPPLVNIASGIETPVRTVLEELLGLGGAPDLVIEARAGRAIDVDRAVADITTLRGLGFTPTYSLSRTLTGMLSYYADL